MAKFVIEIADEDIENFEHIEARISIGQVYPECDTREFVEYEIIERVDDEYQTRVCHCDTDCCSD